MHLRACLGLVALSVLGCASKERATASTTKVDPAALVARVRTSDTAFAAFGRPAARPAAILALARHADGASTIGLDPARSVAIRALDVGHVEAVRADGASVFAGVGPATDLLLAATGDGFEEVRVLHDRSARTIARWAIEPRDGIREVRVREGAVEAVDEHGHVAVRTAPIFAVDARGARRLPRLSLARNGAGYVLDATLDAEGLAYPLTLDPVWLPGPSMAVARSGHAAARAADGKVYVACGGNSFEVFDPATNSFSTKAPSLAAGYSCHMTIGADGKVRVIDFNGVHTYDLASNTWTAANATTPRFGPAVVPLADGKILVASGSVDGLYVTTTEIYDPATATFTARAPMKTGRDGAMAALLPGGKVLVAGGFASARLSSTEIYDVASNTWSDGPNLPEPRADAAVAVMPDGKVVFAGGRLDSGDTATTLIFDPATSAFTSGPSLSAARADAIAVVSSDGRLFVIGGRAEGGEAPSNVVDVAPPGLASFSATAPLYVGRTDATATALLDGRILVAGGSSYMGSYASTEMLSSFPNGKACTWGGECISGFCASGVCCNAACNGECERCNLSGSAGTCSSAPANTECGGTTSCSGSTFTARGKCAGTTCNAAAPITCAGALVCADATGCLNKCSKDQDCTTGACDVASGLCVVPAADAGPPVAPVPEGSPKVLGSAQRCTSPSECASGFCVDGVCCDSACTSKCHSCALPSAPGRCTEEPLGVDLRNECGAALSCSGTCGAGGVCTTSVAGSQCKPSVCTGPTKGVGPATCKATGTPCDEADVVPFECGAYICDEAFGACRTSCNASDACAPGYTCNVTTKSCEAPPTEDDSGCAVTRVGAGPRTAGALSVLAALGIAFGVRGSRGSRRRGR